MSLKVTNARRKQRVRNSLRRSANGRPRLSVFRSSKHIYAQVIDDLKGETLASASSLEKAMVRLLWAPFSAVSLGTTTSGAAVARRSPFLYGRRTIWLTVATYRYLGFGPEG
jgi:ribosomal protein L18